jgi:hypothetical protein
MVFYPFISRQQSRSQKSEPDGSRHSKNIVSF